jgi:hypothetical protein
MTLHIDYVAGEVARADSGPDAPGELLEDRALTTGGRDVPGADPIGEHRLVVFTTGLQH